MSNQYFHSNCLLEAIKAKLKNPKKVRILRIPARLNAVPCSHFMWTDGKKEYDFGKLGHISWYQYPWQTKQMRFQLSLMALLVVRKIVLTMQIRWGKK